MGGAGESAASDVAVVGMACVLPGAPDVEAFWANVVDGIDSVSEVPASRWQLDRHFDPDYDSSTGSDEPMSISKWGGFIPDVGFDALAWGIPPASLASIDPAQLLALKCAGGALADAGYGPEGRPFDRERASVIYATGSGGASELPAGFLLRLLLRTHGIYAKDLPPALDAFLPRLTEDGLPGVLTSVIAGRVANRLDLGGKNLTVDSACASVLVALDIACNELRGGSSDLVLCGGVDLHNGAQDYVSFTAAQALARSGRCRSFDVDADGMTLAEGAGCLVLKRFDDARRDGDRVYAVVRGVAGSSDGRHLGLTAPRQQGQMRAVRRAYAATGVSPAAIGLVEAHGTGTPTGDRTELATTTEIFSEAGAAPGSVVLGSVKSNIGHTKCASGMASLIKAAKAAYHGVLPPTLHVRQPNEVWDPATSPFAFLDRARPWLDADGARLAAVSSFGFGGTNFHAILASPDAPSPSSGRPHWPAEVFLFRDDGSAAALATRLADELAPPRQADRWRLRDIAAAVNATGSGPVTLAVVAHDLDDLVAKLDAAAAARSVPGVYPGRSSEARTEGRPAVGDLVVAFPHLRSLLPADCAPALLPAQAFDDETRAQQAAALATVADTVDTIVDTIVAGALVAVGVPADAAAGLQLGDEADGVTALLHVVAQLAVDGVAINVDALSAGRGCEPERWLTPGRPAGWIVNGHYARAASGASLPKGLHPADESPQISLGNGNGVAPTTPTGAVDPADLAVVAEYLKIVQGMIATGSEIIRSQVGTP